MYVSSYDLLVQKYLPHAMKGSISKRNIVHFLRLSMTLFLSRHLILGVRRAVCSAEQFHQYHCRRHHHHHLPRSARFLVISFLPKSNRSTSFVYPLKTTRWVSGGNTNSSNGSNTSEEEEFVNNPAGLPYREYGYRSRPFTWDELHQIIVEDQELARLSRSVEDEERYGKERKLLLEQYDTIYDHILCSKFKFDKVVDDVSGKWKAVKNRTGNSSEEKPMMVLLPNDFPYFIDFGIEHWVLWKLQSNITQEDVDHSIEELEDKYGDVIDTIWWENPPALKSLPDINHIHILVRRKMSMD